eukprot:Em0028g17a
MKQAKRGCTVFLVPAVIRLHFQWHAHLSCQKPPVSQSPILGLTQLISGLTLCQRTSCSLLCWERTSSWVEGIPRAQWGTSSWVEGIPRAQWGTSSWVEGIPRAQWGTSSWVEGIPRAQWGTSSWVEGIPRAQWGTSSWVEGIPRAQWGTSSWVEGIPRAQWGTRIVQTHYDNLKLRWIEMETDV